MLVTFGNRNRAASEDSASWELAQVVLEVLPVSLMLLVSAYRPVISPGALKT